MNPQQQHKHKNPVKNNIFVYRMKRVAKKKSIEPDVETSVIGRERSSVERFLTYEQQVEKQRQAIVRKGSPINLSQNMRQTLSPRNRAPNRPPAQHFAKIKHQIGILMPQLAQVQKNRNNLSLIFSTTSTRPLWRSLELHSPKNIKKSSNKATSVNSGSGRSSRGRMIDQCRIFRKLEPKGQEIQFCNTNNIFIFKKIKQGQRQKTQFPVLKGSQIMKPACIKYKNQETFRAVKSQRNQINDTQNTITIADVQDSNNKSSHRTTQRQSSLYYHNNTEGHRLFEGKFVLQPWNHISAQEQLNQLRTSLLVFQ